MFRDLLELMVSTALKVTADAVAGFSGTGAGARSADAGSDVFAGNREASAFARAGGPRETRAIRQSLLSPAGDAGRRF